MPKLLDVIKELGLSHTEAIEILTKWKPDTEIEESEDIEEEVPEMEVPEEDDEMEDEEPELEETPEETISLTPEELKQKITDAVEEVTKAKVGKPSKGKESRTPVPEPAVIKKNWFEEKV